MRIATPLAQAGLLNADPVAGDLGIAGAKLVVPGDPEKSILYQRLKRTDFFRMPPVLYHDEPSLYSARAARVDETTGRPCPGGKLTFIICLSPGSHTIEKSSEAAPIPITVNGRPWNLKP